MADVSLRTVISMVGQGVPGLDAAFGAGKWNACFNKPIVLTKLAP